MGHDELLQCTGHKVFSWLAILEMTIDKNSACLRIFDPNQKIQDKMSTVVIRDTSGQI